MALGPLTYKTPNAINLIDRDLTDYEGCGITLTAANRVDLATAQTEIPYGVVIVGTGSIDGLYPSSSPTAGIGIVAAGALELVDAYGAVVQALAGTGGVSANDPVLISAGGAFITTGSAVGDYVWGIALTDANAGEQFLLRFSPYLIQ